MRRRPIYDQMYEAIGMGIIGRLQEALRSLSLHPDKDTQRQTWYIDGKHTKTNPSPIVHIRPQYQHIFRGHLFPVGHGASKK